MADKEFYGDRVVNRLEKVTRTVSGILVFFGTLIPFLLSVARIAHWKQLTDLVDEKNTGITSFQIFLLLIFIMVFSFLIKKIPAIINRIRRSRLYPRETFIRQGHGTISDMKTKKGDYDSRRHFFRITHSLDPVGVWVEVDQETYQKARSNDTIPIRYHPEKTGMLYVNVEKVNTLN